MDLRDFSSVINIRFDTLQEIYSSINTQYTVFAIPKKRGGKRQIVIPSDTLKEIQKNILLKILEAIPVSNRAYGFRKGLSIVDNAKIHVNKECILALDIEDFFPTISAAWITKALIKYGLDKETAGITARLCTYKKFLPQGSPASPYLSNIVCMELDLALDKLAEQHNCSYTRYADDITFSGNNDVAGILTDAANIIKAFGFNINTDKTHVRFCSQQQLVTGIVVNTRPSVPNSLKKRMRQHIHYCIKFGVKSHVKRIEFSGNSFKRHIYGLCSFIKMVDPELGQVFYRQLNEIDWNS